jgi:hypothetical protein
MISSGCHASLMANMVAGLSLVDSPRLCGALWREGPGDYRDRRFVWKLGRRNKHLQTAPWLEHKLLFKSGIGFVAKPMAAVEIMSFLDEA